MVGREFLSADPKFRVDNDPLRVMLCCPSCKSNKGVRPCGAAVDPKMTPRVVADQPHLVRPLIDASGCNAMLVYNQYVCSNSECPGKDGARTFSSHDPRVIALLPAALQKVLPAAPSP